ncbi:MAG TPA: histidine phosphatase family protein [Candidatus Blautia stercoripullorum]|uniref:Histidine phosphatase family protein n=1 Tax=Candidatus Blautia stercoripullorum TaxID=2838502 RepID=A0A9D2R8V1_9FIRM|nr:histidine phosphatase family protein [Candidatus Blautia stercoripullorum]
MTTIYFVRHAKPDYQNHNDRLRELTEKGLEDSRSVTAFLSDKKIDLILSSPYRRAIDTIKNFADKNEMPILIVDDFREIRNFMPWILQFDFFANDFVSMREYRLCKNLWKEISP